MIRGRRGQTIVELLLILPFFMLMLFAVLELGNIAYHTILAHHAAYEMARVAGMVGVTKMGGATDKSRIDSKLREQADMLFAGRNDRLTFATSLETTSYDAQNPTHVNEDVIVEVTYPVRLIFPGTSWLLADQPKYLGMKYLKASVRMPVERPLIN
ncbi:MAG: pilus assembly protein [Elusimicrobium sp.]|jgi:Flp pilus assembly protein TadG|nr:pilus assembly protein [Elusimicrobium sp.]